MTYENFQNLGEAKNQETGKGEQEGGLESPECALTMSTREFPLSFLTMHQGAHSHSQSPLHYT